MENDDEAEGINSARGFNGGAESHTQEHGYEVITETCAQECHCNSMGMRLYQSLVPRSAIATAWA